MNHQRAEPPADPGTAGDLPPDCPPMFVCLATVDGGGPGGAAADCTWTYRLDGLGGEPLDRTEAGEARAVEERVPAAARHRRTEYDRPADRSVAMAYRDLDGVVQLYQVCGEVPKRHDKGGSNGR